MLDALKLGTSRRAWSFDPPWKIRVMSSEEAITDLQVRLTYQEDDMKALNLVVTQQQAQIDALRRDIERLRELLAQMAQARPDPIDDERPPHY
ncbi:SlyX family protein [Thiorhodococcus mannitoliphagus]|uniref:SlyX family protein n=1 Tax=Thiorhodococcus mannitoliphagus TaxID=329406 RepID=A0A6P1DYU1_9GAMM|nr:SlyX family protein [Thiorhodococcus mannitoliphagus]